LADFLRQPFEVFWVLTITNSISRLIDRPTRPLAREVAAALASALMAELTARGDSGDMKVLTERDHFFLRPLAALRLGLSGSNG